MTNKGPLLIILACILWSSTSYLIRYVGQSSIVFLFFSVFFGAIAIFIYSMTRRIDITVSKKEILQYLLLTIIYLPNILLFFKSLQMTSIANALFGHYTAPLFAAFFASYFLKERIGYKTMILLGSSLSGIALIGLDKGYSLTGKLGILYALISGLFYGLSIVYMKNLVMKDMIKPLLYVFTTMSIILSPVIFFSEADITIKAMMIMSASGFIVTGIGNIIYANGLRTLKASYAGILSYTELLFGLMIGFLLFEEKMGILGMIGGFIIIACGITIASYANKERNTK
jgi:drug/metabolite transporter (DMT)-like permease